MFDDDKEFVITKKKDKNNEKNNTDIKENDNE
jgi:hypothetical protein